MRANFMSETEMPGTGVTRDQLRVICLRYYFASQFVSGKEVLEVGCGPGLGLGYLARSARRVTGGDCTEASLRRAHEHYKGRVGLLSLDAHSLPFKNSCSDIVIAMATTIYLHMDKFLDECHRVLKEDGTLICCMPNKDSPGFNESPLSNRYYSASELFTLLGQHHFEAKLFGAFPAGEVTAWQKLLLAAANTVGKALDLVPRSKRAKELIKQLVFRTTMLNSELDEEMVENAQVKNIQLEPIPGNSPDLHHRVLYVIANAR